MKDFWEKFTTNRYWFVGTLFVVLVIFLFFWRLIDHDGFVVSINGFLRDLWEILKFILIIVCIVIGVRVMFGWRPFGLKGHH